MEAAEELGPALAGPCSAGSGVCVEAVWAHGVAINSLESVLTSIKGCFMARSSLSFAALLGFVVAVAVALGGALAGPAYRWDVLELGDAFTLLRWAAYGGLAAVAVSLAGLARARPGAGRRGLLLSLLGVALGAAAFWMPYSHYRLAQSVPPIHDITTDPESPARFEAVVPLRPDDANSLRYGGESVARQQRQAYPDIRPATFDNPREAVFQAALDTAADLGWRIVARDEEAGRIEAVDTTIWFGFQDDVVVRLGRDNGSTRVDVRSVSRVGVSDVGMNAARIRDFMAGLEGRLQQ